MCTFYIYSDWCFPGSFMYAHVLICINRIWAVVLSVSYQNFHNAKTAMLLCVGVLIFVHVIGLPLIVRDAMYYRLPVKEYGCRLNDQAQKKLASAVDLVIFTFPVIFIIASCPYLWIQRRKQMKIRPGATHTGTYIDSLNIPAKTLGTVKKNSKTSSLFILTVMTISISICWAPGQIAYLLQAYADIDTSSFAWISHTLFDLQSALDPLVFGLTLKDIRRKIAAAFRCEHNN